MDANNGARERGDENDFHVLPLSQSPPGINWVLRLPAERSLCQVPTEGEKKTKVKKIKVVRQ